MNRVKHPFISFRNDDIALWKFCYAVFSSDYKKEGVLF